MPQLNRKQILDAMSEIEKMDLKNSTLKDIQLLLEPFFEGLTLYGMGIKPNDVNIVRGRICEKPTHISGIIYPAPEHVKYYGRVNDIGQSMFYGSVGKVAPFYELGAKVGDKFIMGVWNNLSEIVLIHIGFTSETAKKLKSSRELHSIYNFAKDTGDDDLNTLVYNYLSQIFTLKVDDCDNHLYKISVTISNILTQADETSGIMYPSIAFSGNTDNIVLKPDFVDKNLELFSVEYIRIIEINGQEYLYETLDTATSIKSDGEIDWTGRLLTYSSEGTISASIYDNEWKPRDAAGNRIRPKSNGYLISRLTKLIHEFKKSEGHLLKKERVINVQFNMPGFEIIEIEVLKNLNYNVTNKEKYLSFYIPDTQICNRIAQHLIQNYQEHLTIEDDGQRIRLFNPVNGGLIYTSEESVFNNIIEIYSEREFNTTGLIGMTTPNIKLKFIFGDMISTQ